MSTVKKIETTSKRLEDLKFLREQLVCHNASIERTIFDLINILIEDEKGKSCQDQ